MARTAGKKQAAQKFEEPEEAEGWEDAVVEADDKDGGADLRLRDWRDVERFREMKDLRRLVDDDYGLEEIFHVPLKPRTEVPPRTPKLALPVRNAVAAKAPLKSDVKLAAKAQVPPKKAVPKSKAKAKAKVKVKARTKPRVKAKRR